MARPSARRPADRTSSGTAQQVLAHPLARGISPDEVRDFLAKLPRGAFRAIAYAEARRIAAASSRAAAFRCSTRSGG